MYSYGTAGQGTGARIAACQILAVWGRAARRVATAVATPTDDHICHWTQGASKPSPQTCSSPTGTGARNLQTRGHGRPPVVDRGRRALSIAEDQGPVEGSPPGTGGPKTILRRLYCTGAVPSTGAEPMSLLRSPRTVRSRTSTSGRSGSPTTCPSSSSTETASDGAVPPDGSAGGNPSSGRQCGFSATTATAGG